MDVFTRPNQFSCIGQLIRRKVSIFICLQQAVLQWFQTFHASRCLTSKESTFSLHDIFPVFLTRTSKDKSEW